MPGEGDLFYRCDRFLVEPKALPGVVEKALLYAGRFMLDIELSQAGQTVAFLCCIFPGQLFTLRFEIPRGRPGSGDGRCDA